MRNLKTLVSQIKLAQWVVLILLGGCQPQSDIVYDHCQIQSFVSEDFYGIYENGQLKSIERRELHLVTYFNYKNGLLISTETKNQKGEITSSKTFNYYPDGKWWFTFNGNVKDSAVYAPNKFTVYERRFSVQGQDTIYLPHQTYDSISFFYKNGNLLFYTLPNTAIKNDPIKVEYEYNNDIARIDIRNLTIGYPYFPPDQNYFIKETYSSPYNTSSVNIDYRLNSSAWPVVIKYGLANIYINYTCE